MTDPLERLVNLEIAYDITSPYYKFTYKFRNLVNVPNGLQTTETYPVILRGYGDLKKRTEQQKTISTKIEGSIDALSDKFEKISTRSNILQQRMQNILIKLRNSELRAKYVMKKKIHLSGTAELGDLPQIRTFEASEQLPKNLHKMRLVLTNLLNAIRVSKNNNQK